MSNEQLKIVFKSGDKTSDIIWRIVESRKTLVLLESELGLFWANKESSLFQKNELLIDVTSESNKRLEELIRWVDYQFAGINNLFVLIEPVIDDSGSNSLSSKVMQCKYRFNRREWTTKTGVWVDHELGEKLTKLPKSEIRVLPSGKSVAPLWLIVKNLPANFSTHVECIRLIEKLDLLNLIYSHRNKLLSI